MAAKLRLTRKSKWTILLLALMIVALPVLAIRSYMAKIAEDKILVGAPAADERLIYIDGHTALVHSEALGQGMKAWLASRKYKTLLFELSDRSFQANSAVPSAITETRMDQVAGLARTDSAMMVHILAPTAFASSAIRKLDEQRMARLRDDLVSHGVASSHVTIDRETDNLPTARSQQIAILLDKDGTVEAAM